jgi:hypothetical protein
MAQRKIKMKKNLNLTIALLSGFLLLLSLSKDCFSQVTYKLTNGSSESFQNNNVQELDSRGPNIPNSEPSTQDLSQTQDLAGKTPEINDASGKSISNNQLSLDKIDQSRFMNIAELQGLNKITAKASILEAKIEEPIKFGSLIIIVHKCWQAPINQRPDSKILVEIFELKHNANGSDIKDRIFYGWLIASDPAVSALEHPIYDVSALNCKK